MVSRVSGKWNVYGVVSYVLIERDEFGRSRCLSEKPSFFTRVFNYNQWILDNL